MHRANKAIIEREKLYWEMRDKHQWLTPESIQSTIHFLPQIAGRVLELCSGSGMFTRFMPRTFEHYTCLDLSARLLDTLKSELPYVHTIVGDAHDLNFPPQSFDNVLIFAGLHHLPDRGRVLEGVYKILKPKGRFICFEPNENCWYRKPMLYFRNALKLYTQDEIFLHPEEIRNLIHKVGFSETDLKYTTPHVTPIKSNLVTETLSRCMDLAARLSRSSTWQAWFIVIATK